MTRRRCLVSADEWRRRLDECMAMVLAQPQNYHPCVQWWARWRREWLAESGSLFREPAARAETAEGEGLTGPSSRPPAAGGTDCAIDLAAAPKIGCHSPVVTPSPPATSAESTTSEHSILSLTGDNRNARGGGNGARSGGGCGGAVQNKEV